MRNKKGITLIALVITIIVLLILAGVSLSFLAGENGILGRATKAVDKNSEASVKERVELLLAEYPMAKAEDRSLQLLEFLNQQKDEGKLDKVKDNQDGTIDCDLNGYTVKIDAESLKIIKIEKSNDIEISYQLVSYENNKFILSIRISDESNGIASIEFPDGKRTYDGEKVVEIENYEVEEGKDYIVIVKNTNGIERTETINFVKPAEPTIDTTAKIGYPTFTLTGVEGTKLEIQYAEGTDFTNYYSLDDGQTWNLYTGPINATTSNIMAKSELKKCPEIYTESKVTIEKPEEALGVEGYDGDLDTCYKTDYVVLNGVSGNFLVFNLDSSTWGKYCDIVFSIGAQRAQNIQFYDTEGSLLKTLPLNVPGVSYLTGGVIYDVRLDIPENVGIIKMESDVEISIYEITINKPSIPKMAVEYDETKINKTALEYPLLTLNGGVNCSINPEVGTKIKIEMPNNQPEGVENYYSLDGGKNWEKYTKSIETTYQGEGLIQAKSINKYYNVQSDINVLKNYMYDAGTTCTASNAAGNNAFDGDEESYIEGNVLRMDIDESVLEKKIKIKYETHGTRAINFHGSNGRLVHNPWNGESGVVTRTTTVPSSSAYILFGWEANDKVYEIEISNGPAEAIF